MSVAFETDDMRLPHTIRVYAQSRGFCGPTALRIVLRYFGIATTERALARLSGATPAAGVPALGIVRAAQALGCAARVVDHSSIVPLQRCLEHNVPSIVNVWSRDDGHYAVVVGLNPDRVLIADPAVGAFLEVPLGKFCENWWDLEPDGRLIDRRTIIVVPPRSPGEG